MKILRAQGHFGTMDGREICFADGLNVLCLPNEGGKTTLCDFIRVMLYGLNTSKRDGKQQLSDKTKYRPADGCPMSGILELEWKQRRIILSRQTGKGGPMQEFSARYADTGEEVRDLTSKDCGETLTGVGEEAFRSSALIDGMNQAVSAEELSERILALSTTGDGAMMYSRAIGQLDKWKAQLRGGTHGRLGQVEAEQDTVAQNRIHYEELEREIAGYTAQLTQAEQQAAQKEQEHQKIYEQFMLLFAGKREAAEREERRAREAAADTKSRLPDLKALKTAEKAAQEYKKVLKEAQEVRADAEDITRNYVSYRQQLDEKEREFDENDGAPADIHIHPWGLAAAVACVVLAALSFLGVFPIGGTAGRLVSYLFCALAVAFLIFAYFHSTQSISEATTDFVEERQKLDKRLARAKTHTQETEDELRRAEEKMMSLAQSLSLSMQTPEEVCRQIDDLVMLREEYFNRKQRHEELSEQYLDILEMTGPNGEERRRLNAAEEEMQQAQKKRDELRQSIAVCRGRCEEIGSKESLDKRWQELKDERTNILWNLDAIAQARQALVRVNAELTGRMAPQINQLAQKYLQILTANKYTALQMYTNFEAVCRAENSAVEMDRLRLSTGTRDQLYFALRLAACMVLLDTKFETVPLILDDPFLTYDDERTASAMALLRELAYDRQIILVTCHKPNVASVAVASENSTHSPR